jgi:hypothetical protein
MGGALGSDPPHLWATERTPPYPDSGPIAANFAHEGTEVAALPPVRPEIRCSRAPDRPLERCLVGAIPSRWARPRFPWTGAAKTLPNAEKVESFPGSTTSRNGPEVLARSVGRALGRASGAQKGKGPGPFGTGPPWEGDVFVLSNRKWPSQVGRCHRNPQFLSRRCTFSSAPGGHYLPSSPAGA